MFYKKKISIKLWWLGSNLRRYNGPNSNHQKNIDISQIIAFGKLENYGSIKSMKKSILLFIYRNYPKILSVAQKYFCWSDFWGLTVEKQKIIGKLSKWIELAITWFNSIQFQKKIIKMIIDIELTASILCMTMNRQRLLGSSTNKEHSDFKHNQSAFSICSKNKMFSFLKIEW